MNMFGSKLTLWQVLSSEDPQGECGPSQRQTSWSQQVALYVFFILHTLASVSLETDSSCEIK